MRYEVVTYSADIGTDEKLDFSRKRDAIAHAKTFRGTEEYAAVYDTKTKTSYVIFGNPHTRIFADCVTVVGGV